MRVAIIGQGYVGLTIGVGAAGVGHSVVGFDVNEQLVTALNAGTSHIEGISDADIAGLNIPTGIPLLYELDANFKPVKAGGEYLDPAAAADAITAVANQGKK